MKLRRLAVAVAVAAAGCASSHQSAVPTLETSPASTLQPVSAMPQESETASSTSGTRYSANELFLVAALGPEMDQVDSYGRGADLHRARCMREKGYENTPPLAPLAGTGDSFSTAVNFLYFEDRDLVEEYGYFWPGRTLGQLPEAVSDTEIPEAQLQALELCNEDIRDGVRAAYGKLGLDLETDAVSLDEIDGQIFTKLSGRPEVQNVYQAWKECMADTGFAQATLREPIDNADGETIEKALADFDCRVSTGYTTVLVRSQASEVRSWIEMNPELVTRYEALWEELALLGTSLAGES